MSFEPGKDYLCDLLDFAMPWLDGMAAVLIAHVDASKRPSGVFSVGLVAFGADRAKKATRGWDRLWGKTSCHMTDWHARRGPFTDWSADKSHGRLVESLGIVNRYASYAVAVSCDAADVEKLAPKGADANSKVFHDGLARSYALCCHMAMYSLARLAPGARQNPPRIAYFFESGDAHQGESQRFISEVVSGPMGAALYGCRSHSKLAKTDSRLFEIADIVAWEWAKHIDRIGEGKTQMRGSLKALLGEGHSSEFDFASDSRVMMHMRGPALERFYLRCEETGIFSDHPTPEQTATALENAKRSSLFYSA
ncbi:MAG: hypothetical protein Q8M19_10825 [Reyranella sp.]|nr:hypothetical protein [Reyranella sp.]